MLITGCVSGSGRFCFCFRSSRFPSFFVLFCLLAYIHPDFGLALSGVGDRNTTWSIKGVACEGCGLWFHATCKEIGSQSYELLNDS